MKASKVAQSTARRIFRLCSPNGKMNVRKLKSVIKKIGAEKPRDYRGILQVLKRLVENEVIKKQVTVESAAKLDAPTLGKVQTSLCKEYGEGLTFKFKVDPELLGGLRIRVGNDVYDGSVKARLETLANSF
ncbi:MAG: F0F1 ATP synthase subunit delta [Akkermansiaceae bacterium]|nr:F0F1 ATP synthase subunit delta [Akkermansiaceae bacterium]OUV09995.1 MAG: hypothetical protein CBC46_12075 [Verrucomicrobiaceae bacterium TMED86]